MMYMYWHKFQHHIIYEDVKKAAVKILWS